MSVLGIGYWVLVSVLETCIGPHPQIPNIINGAVPKDSLRNWVPDEFKHPVEEKDQLGSTFLIGRE